MGVVSGCGLTQIQITSYYYNNKCIRIASSSSKIRAHQQHIRKSEVGFKMAASTGTVLGYQCEFIDPVPEDFHCKQCSLVARRLTITSCCGESYCKVCIDNIQQDARPCPGCGEESFTTLQQVKNQRKIAALKVQCSMKERGCIWSGVLEHLDVHLDPDQGDCQYIDIVCPLKCDKKTVRKNIDHHTIKECVKRDYVCPYCALRGSYEIVSTVHWPECTYYPTMPQSLWGHL